MKKPEETKSASDKQASGEISTPKKDAAESGTVAFRDTGAGDGSAATASGGKIESADSTLVGDGKNGRPAASPKQPATSIPAVEKAAPAASDVTSGASVAPTASTQNVAVKKTGFWPVVLGGVVAAGLGSAATIWALPHLPVSWLPPAPEPQAAAAPEIDTSAIVAEAVANAEAAAQSRIDALRTELANAPAPEIASPEPDARIEDILAQLEQQGQRIEQLATQPSIDPEIAQKVQSLADKAAALEGQISAAAQDAQSTIAAAQAEAQKLQEAAADSTRRAEAVAAIARLQTALDRGVTSDQARETLESAGLEAPESLTRDIPSRTELQDSFGDAARSALRASLRSDGGEGGNPITNFLRAQTGARSVAPREGQDTDAILSRAGAEVEAGDITAAMTELADLSEAARNAPAMADWLARATAYQDAISALSDLSAKSN